MPTPNQELMKRMALAFTRKMRGERPRVYANGGISPAGRFEMGDFSSSEPMNRDFFARNGESMKMVGPDRINNNMWYSNPEHKELHGYSRDLDPQEFKRRVMAKSSAPNQYQREMAQRAYDAQVGQQVARQIAQMRQVSPNGILQDPRFIQYQAKVIKDRIYNKNLNGFINGQYSARDLANVEDYLKSVSDDEVVRNFPFFFDYENDGAKYLMDLEKQNIAEQLAPVESSVYGEDLNRDALMEYYRRKEAERMVEENPWLRGEILGEGTPGNMPPAGTP